MVPKLQGLVSRCKTLLPGEKSRPLVKGWGVGCFTTRLLSPQFTSCCHGAASFGNGMPYSGGSWRAQSSVPHHNQVLRLDLGS